MPQRKDETNLSVTERK